MDMEFSTTIGENGRLILPIKIRKALNVVSGDRVMLLLSDRELRIRTLKDTVKNYQAMIKRCNVNNVSLVDSLKQSRIQEADDE
jgi:AbrB family looped-hinge helix DNA binding protein